MGNRIEYGDIEGFRDELKGSTLDQINGAMNELASTVQEHLPKLGAAATATIVGANVGLSAAAAAAKAPNAAQGKPRPVHELVSLTPGDSVWHESVVFDQAHGGRIIPTVHQIESLNHLSPSDVKRLPVGLKLKLPDTYEADVVELSPGDSIWQEAEKKVGDNPRADLAETKKIEKANGITSEAQAEALPPGTKLFIPDWSSKKRVGAEPRLDNGGTIYHSTGGTEFPSNRTHVRVPPVHHEQTTTPVTVQPTPPPEKSAPIAATPTPPPAPPVSAPAAEAPTPPSGVPNPTPLPPAPATTPSSPAPKATPALKPSRHKHHHHAHLGHHVHKTPPHGPHSSSTVVPFITPTVTPRRHYHETKKHHPAIVHHHNQHHNAAHTILKWECSPTSTHPLIGGNRVMKAIHYFMLCNGDSLAGATAMVGNMEHEDVGLDPLRIENGGGDSRNPADAGSLGWGIVQWTPGSKARTAANEVGIPNIYKLRSQLALVAYETNHISPTGAVDINQQLKTATDPTAAAAAFEVGFEGAAGGGNLPDRQALATQAVQTFQSLHPNGYTPPTTTSVVPHDSRKRHRERHHEHSLAVPKNNTSTHRRHIHPLITGIGRVGRAAEAHLSDNHAAVNPGIYQDALRYDTVSYSETIVAGHEGAQQWHATFPVIGPQDVVDCSGLVNDVIYDYSNNQVNQNDNTTTLLTDPNWKVISWRQAGTGDLIEPPMGPSGVHDHVEIIGSIQGDTINTFGAHTANVPQPEQVSPAQYTYDRRDIFLRYTGPVAAPATTPTSPAVSDTAPTAPPPQIATVTPQPPSSSPPPDKPPAETPPPTQTTPPDNPPAETPPPVETPPPANNSPTDMPPSDNPVPPATEPTPPANGDGQTVNQGDPPSQANN